MEMHERAVLDERPMDERVGGLGPGSEIRVQNVPDEIPLGAEIMLNIGERKCQCVLQGRGVGEDGHDYAVLVVVK